MRLEATLGALVLAAGMSGGLAASPSPSPNRVTIVYDAFGGGLGLTRDWGFSALVEYGGKRILFDTGDNAGIFGRNVRALHVDLKRLDFVVISHRHGDHVAGMSYLLRVNPRVKIYAPREGFGIFGASLPASFYRRDESLPDSMRYFAGAPPDTLAFGTVWPGANLELVDSIVRVAPGVTLIATVSKTPGTLELRELSLAVSTPEGLMIMVGCSHPGIETILAASRAAGSHVHAIIGGLHLVTTADTTIARIAASLHDHWQVDVVAPGHCTGEPAFAVLRRLYGDHYLYAGLGTVIDLP